MKIPRTTVEQKSYCTKVARNKARMGDLVFFGSGKSENSVSHVGLYIGKGEMIHASSSRGVMVSRVDAGYWGDRFRGIGRIDGAYASWAKTDRGAKSSKKKEKDNRREDDIYPSPAAPSEIPSPVSPVPVPSAEIAFNELPSCLGKNGDDTASKAVVAGQAASDATGNNNAAKEVALVTAKGKNENPEPRNVAENADPVASIDLLDMIINQKADSIFSERFMD
jgi:hypothetical protein